MLNKTSGASILESWTNLQMSKNHSIDVSCWLSWRDGRRLPGRMATFPSSDIIYKTNWMRLYWSKVDSYSFTVSNWPKFTDVQLTFFNPNHVAYLSDTVLGTYNFEFCKNLGSAVFNKLTPRQFGSLFPACFEDLGNNLWAQATPAQLYQLSDTQIGHFPTTCSTGPFSVMSCPQLKGFKFDEVLSTYVSLSIRACWVAVRSPK